MSVKASSVVAHKINTVQQSTPKDDPTYYFRSVEVRGTHALLESMVRRMVKFDLDEYCKREFSSFKLNKLKEWVGDKRKSHEVREFHRKKLQSLDTLEKRHVVGSLELDIADSIINQLNKHNSFYGLGLFDLDHHFLKYLCFYQKQGNKLVLIKDNQLSCDGRLLLPKGGTLEEIDYTGIIPSMGSAFMVTSLPKENLDSMPSGAMVVSFNENWHNNPKFRTRLFSKIDAVIEKNISRTFLDVIYKDTRKDKVSTTTATEKKITNSKASSLDDNISHKLPSAFYDRMSKHPRCKYSKASKSVYVALDKSGAYPYIETQSQQYQNILCIDIDNGKSRKELLNRWKQKGVPAPSVIILNPNKVASAQYLYFLKVPLKITSFRAMNYLKDVTYTLTTHLEGDQGYNGIYCKNPLFVGHEVITPFTQGTTNISIEYYLFELKDFSGVEKVSRWTKSKNSLGNKHSITNPLSVLHSEGRNTTLFNLGRLFGSQVIGRLRAENLQSVTSFENLVFGYLLSKNTSLYKKNPLSINEVKGIAKSISQWQWSHYENNYAENLIKDEGELSKRDQHVIKVIEDKICQCIPLHQISSTLKLSLRRVKEYGEFILKKLYKIFKDKVVHNFGMTGRVTVANLQQYISEWFEQTGNESYKTYINMPSASTIKKWKKDYALSNAEREYFDEGYEKDAFADKLSKKRINEKEYSHRYRQEKIIAELQKEQSFVLTEESKVLPKRTKNRHISNIRLISAWITSLIGIREFHFLSEKSPIDFETNFVLNTGQT